MTFQTIQDIKQALLLLPAHDREDLAWWVLGLNGVREAAPAYKASTSDEAEFLSVEEYLQREEISDIRHEYVGGTVYAMSGASEAHNIISGNLFSALHAHVRGGPCRAYMPGFKVRFEINHKDIFYYPDAMVACRREGVETHFLRYPKLVVEVLSPSTASIDRREKLLHYTQIPSVEEYFIVSQSLPRLVAHRRAADWAPQKIIGLEALAEFRSVALSLSLAKIYEGVFC